MTSCPDRKSKDILRITSLYLTEPVNIVGTYVHLDGPEDGLARWPFTKCLYLDRSMVDKLTL